MCYVASAYTCASDSCSIENYRSSQTELCHSTKMIVANDGNLANYKIVANDFTVFKLLSHLLFNINNKQILVAINSLNKVNLFP